MNETRTSRLYQVRNCVRSDWDDIVDISMSSCETPFTKDAVGSFLGHRAHNGIVIFNDEAPEIAIGFAFYSWVETKERNQATRALVINEIAVDALFQGRGAASSMIDKIKQKTGILQCNCVRAYVHEDNTGVLRFFGKHGFVCFNTNQTSVEINDQGFFKFGTPYSANNHYLMEYYP